MKSKKQLEESKTRIKQETSSFEKEIEKYYKYFGLAKIKDKNKVLRNKELFNILKTPTKDKGAQVPHMNDIQPNCVYQADLIYLPTDPDGSKFALVVVDVSTGKTDAEPLKERNAEAVLKAIKTIFNRKILIEPKYILQTDNGSEFKGVFKEYFKNKGILIRYGKVGRSRQQAYAEARNKTIGKTLIERQIAQELITNEFSTEWTEFLPDIIKEINEQQAKKHKQKKLKEQDPTELRGNSSDGHKSSRFDADPAIAKNTVMYEI